MPTNAVKAYVESTIAAHDPGPMIIDLGAGEEPNYYQELFRPAAFHKFDLVQNKAGTITHLGDLYKPPRELIMQYSTVLMLEVLEHVPDPALAIFRASQLLTPFGLLIISSVTAWGEHKHPKDYWRFLPDGFRHLLDRSDLKILDVSTQHKDLAYPGAIFATARKINPI